MQASWLSRQHNKRKEVNEMEQTQVQGLNRYFTKIYLLMAMGLFISGGISAAVLVENPLQATMLSIMKGFPLGFWGMWIAELILVVFLSRKAMKNPTMALSGFVLFSALNGFVISFTLSYYDIGSVFQAFIIAGVMFVGMGVVGAFIKRDLSALGQAAIAVLIGVIVMSLLNAFLFKSSSMDMLISAITIVVFAGLTAYDNQQIKKSYQANGANGGFSIFMALSLYLDFINLFLSILRFTGGSSD